MRYVIVGGGIAGTTAAEELRKIDPNGSIVLISEELHRLYSRVLLKHYIKGKVPRERCFLKKETWYDEQNIEVHFGVSVVSLDVKNKFVATSDGREHEYDKLLIATGGEVKTLGEEDRTTCYFRTLDDADHLVQLFGEGIRHATIIGGGFISLEYVNMFADRGIPTDLHLRGDQLFASVLDAQSATLIQDRAEADGIRVYPRSAVTRGDGMTAVGIGIAPELGWIREAGVEVGVGVKTNAFLETNVEDVFSAGDITEFYDTIAERNVLVGNWMNAQIQGRTVAKTMAGERTAFELVSSYATNCRGMEVIFIGDVSRAAAEEVRVVGSKEEGGVAQHFLRGGRIVGASLVNRNADRAELTKLIREKTTV